MAYARLIFPAGTPALKKLKDITRVCSGAVSLNQLEFADQQASELITLEPAGWSIADTPLEVAGTATISEYRLSSPCVDVSKTKYCGLTAFSVPNLISSTTTFSRPVPSSSGAALWTTSGTSIVSGVLQNQTAFIKQATLTGSGTLNIYAQADLSSNIIFISVTARKIFIFTQASIPGFTTLIEFPETHYTVINNNVPVIVYSAADLTTTVSGSTNMANNIASNSYTALTSISSVLYRLSAFSNWYSTSTTQRANTDALASAFQISIPAIGASINTIGNPQFQLIPIIDFRMDAGEGIHNYSLLTDIFYTYRTSTYNGIGDEISVNGFNYVLFTVGASSSSSRTLAIKKA